MSTHMELIGMFMNQDRFGKIYISLDEKSAQLVKAYHQAYKKVKKYDDADFTHPVCNLADFDQVRINVTAKKDLNYLRGAKVSVIVKTSTYGYKNRKGYCFQTNEPMNLEPLGKATALHMDDHGYHAYLELMKDY